MAGVELPMANVRRPEEFDRQPSTPRRLADARYVGDPGHLPAASVEPAPSHVGTRCSGPRTSDRGSPAMEPPMGTFRRTTPLECVYLKRVVVM